MSDVAMTLAVVALFADGPTVIRDVASWRVKETERMIVICTELRKLGAIVEEGPDYCVITPPHEKLHVIAIDTYDGHKMVMAFSLAACADVPVTIKDPGCTRKMFPDYFDVLARSTRYGGDGRWWEREDQPGVEHPDLLGESGQRREMEVQLGRDELGSGGGVGTWVITRADHPG
ncbi:3-phosphoshikimate 1-carboxyvinyltransferase 2 [Dionaea muscipula]